MSLKINKLKQKVTQRFGIVVSAFNEPIILRLLQGCIKEFLNLGIVEKNITVIHVPGAFEIPVAASVLARKKNIDAVVCLGAVIRGETLHFELIAQQAAAGVMKVSLDTRKPIVFGVLTTDTIAQALSRSDDKNDNKGSEAARVAVAMVNVLSKI
ncbi:MAG: 6,7-dimethyl-8-ribityllumazine synthase [Candidatus Omnitrophica bacterium]|nr:6,7-dimethyl-8-ribityllumazine synthase [Candidatus Omnitrophota bacterium]